MAIVESDQNFVLSNFNFKESLTVLINLANKFAEHNSRRGMFIVFNGDTLDFAHKS